MRQGSFFGGIATTLRVRILAVLIVLVCSVCAFAQGGGSVAISGTVTDPTGAVIPGANVTVTEKSTSIVHTAVTGASGLFNIPSIRPTTYTVSVEAAGFKKYVQDIVLLADQTRDMNVRLEVGDTTQQITVEESSVAV